MNFHKTKCIIMPPICNASHLQKGGVSKKKKDFFE